MRKIAKSILLVIVLASALGIHGAVAQEKKKKPKSLRESARKSMHARDSLFQAISKNDTSINSLLQRVAQYTTTFNQIDNSLAQGLDTAEVSEQLPLVVKRIGKVQSLANTKKSGTLRYLFVLRDNIDHLQDQMDGWQTDLDDVNTKLIQNQHDILQFTKDSLLKIVPTDSALRVNYLAQRTAAKALWRKTDSVNRRDLFKINLLQNKVTTAYADVLDADDQIDTKIKRFALRAESGEFGYIWQNSGQYDDFDSAAEATVRLNKIQLGFFGSSEIIVHLVGIAFLVIIGGWIFYNRSKINGQKEHPELIQNHTNYIYTSPVASALLVASAIAPYFYDHPPIIFLETFFLVSLLCAMALVRSSLPKSLFNFLVGLFCLAVVYSLSNLLIQIANFDRFLILLLSIASIVIAVLFRAKVKREPAGHLPYTRTVLAVFIAIECISAILDFTGRFSLAKIVGITAVFNLWMLLTLQLIIQIIIQGIFLQFHTKNAENTFISWIDYNVLQKKFRSTLSAFAALLWVFFLLQNLNIDDWVHDYLVELLNQSRSIGGSSFTFGGFVIFIIVIWLSTLVSKIISYFYDISAQHATDLSALKKKNRASTLLIRIAVFTVGFLLAVAASGFPIDKLTIIFSAFGVGIGFGLQNIVNNLVSGMILAFEKPVQIGDIIEVGTHAGTIKEIGIRSSKLATSDGAEVIIPNGDMISQQVVNWTLSNTNRRVEMSVLVAYGSDIEKVKSLLVELLRSRDDIMDTPGPSVFVNNITDKSIEFRASFWAADISNAPELRSRILVEIYEMLNKNGINMPAA